MARKPLQVLDTNMLSMLDSESPVLLAVRIGNRLVVIEDRRIRLITDRMNTDLKSCLVGTQNVDGGFRNLIGRKAG